MSLFKPVQLFTSTWMIVRHNSKPNIKKPRLPHWIKLKTLETCKPMFAPNLKPQSELCENIIKPKAIRERKHYRCLDSGLHQLTTNALKNIGTTLLPERQYLNSTQTSTFERLLGKELLDRLDQSKLVGFYHANSIKGLQKMVVDKHLFRKKMRLGNYSRDVIKRAVEGTKYEAILPLFCSHTRFVFCEEPNVSVLLKLQKIMPQYLLLAGIVENRLMSRKELEWYGSLPSIEMMHAQLYATLNASSTQMLQNLNHHQMQLSHSLSVLAKPEEKEEPPSPIES